MCVLGTLHFRFSFTELESLWLSEKSAGMRPGWKRLGRFHWCKATTVSIRHKMKGDGKSYRTNADAGLQPFLGAAPRLVLYAGVALPVRTAGNFDGGYDCLLRRDALLYLLRPDCRAR